MTLRTKIIRQLHKLYTESLEKETPDDEYQRGVTNGILEALDTITRIKED